MKVLVTGHKGFIGKRVYYHLKHECRYGELVEGLDRPDDIGDWVGPSGMFAGHYDVITVSYTHLTLPTTPYV